MNYKTEQILLHLLETQIQTLPADIVVKKKEISPHFTTTFFFVIQLFREYYMWCIKVSPQPKRYKLIVC